MLDGTGFRPRSLLDRTCLHCSDRRLGHVGLGRVGNARVLGIRSMSKQAEYEVPSSYKTVREHQPVSQQSSVFSLYHLRSPSTSNIMFGSLILLSGIALFASAVAQPISSPPTTPTLFEVVVGSLEGNTTYTPPYIVSQVRTA